MRIRPTSFGVATGILATAYLLAYYGIAPKGIPSAEYLAQNIRSNGFGLSVAWMGAAVWCLSALCVFLSMASSRVGAASGRVKLEMPWVLRWCCVVDGSILNKSEGSPARLLELSFDRKGMEQDPERRCFFDFPVSREIRFHDPFLLFKGTRVFKNTPEKRKDPAPASELPDCFLSVLHGAGEEMVPEGGVEGDLFDFRDYRKGDSAGRILWKLYARTGGQRIFVRAPEITGGERYAVFFARGVSDEESARIVAALRSYGGASEWLFQCSSPAAEEETSPVYGSSDEAGKRLSRSGNHAGLDLQEREAAALKNFARDAARENIQKLFVLLPSDQASFDWWVDKLNGLAVPPVCIAGYRGTKPGFHYESVIFLK